MDVRVDPLRRLHAKGFILSSWGIGEDSLESFGLQGDQTSQSLKEINLEYSVEGLMLKLKLQHFGHMM